MQCFSFSFPQPITTFSPLKQHIFHPSTSIPCAQNKVVNQSNADKTHTSLVHARRRIPKAGANDANLQSTQEYCLSVGLEPELNIPKHVAANLDGNRRWALKKGLSAEDGYRTSLGKMKNMAGLCSKCGVQVLSFLAITTENWVRRPREELDILTICLKDQLESDLEYHMREGVKVSIIGDTSELPEYLQKAITLVEETTKANTGLHLLVNMVYGGRYDIVQAAKAVATKVSNGEMLVEDINEKSFEEELLTKCSEFPHPDLCIRTGGEQRLSNFWLWQLAYTEFVFLEKCGPDFEDADLISALNSFQRRHRRFGGNKH